MATIDEAMLALVVVGFLIAFLLAFSIGANDVANAFGTSYGSRVLTFVQVCVLASIFETLGAVLLGGRVSSTIAKGIANLDLFKGNPYQLMYGYLSALVGASGWLLIATAFKLPVSGTHSIVGAVIGFTTVAHGTHGINWITLVKIVSSWFTSPLLAGGLAASLFVAVKFLVLNQPNPFDAGCKILPVFYGLTFALISFMVIDESSHKISGEKNTLPIWGVVLAAIGFGVLCWLFTYIIVMPLIRQRIAKKTQATKRENCTGSVLSLPKPTKQPRLTRAVTWTQKKCALIRNNFQNNVFRFSKQSKQNGDDKTGDRGHDNPIKISDDDFVQHPHPIYLEAYISSNHPSDAADSYVLKQVASNNDKNKDVTRRNSCSSSNDVYWTAMSTLRRNSVASQTINTSELDVAETPELRHLFSFIQVVTATFASFSHGANDVSNAVGPIIGMFQIYKTHEVVTKASTEWWILLFGGLSLSVGLWSLGKKVMSTIGDDLTSISPATGFCMELGTALTVLVASHIGVPVSTTHCLVGSVICVSLVKSRKAIDWRVVRNIAFSWLVTVPVSGLISAGCMAALRELFNATHTFDHNV